MSTPTAPSPVIRVETEKVPPVLADRIGKAVYEATMAWAKQNEGKEEDHGVS